MSRSRTALERRRSKGEGQIMLKKHHTRGAVGLAASTLVLLATVGCAGSEAAPSGSEGAPEAGPR